MLLLSMTYKYKFFKIFTLKNYVNKIHSLIQNIKIFVDITQLKLGASTIGIIIMIYKFIYRLNYYF